jgi:predicted transcriptional regulator
MTIQGPIPPESMKTLTIELSDKTAERLESLADQLGMSLEEVAQLSLDDQMKRLGQEYDEAAEQVLSKNAELYRRLS